MQTMIAREKGELPEFRLFITAFLQEERGNGICREVHLERLVAERALDLPAVATAGTPIGEDQNTTAVRVLRGYVIDIRKIALGGEDTGTALHESGIVGQRPIEPAARELLRLGVEREDATAGEGTDVGFAMFIEHQVPSDDRAGPVVEDAREGARPLRPIGCVVREGDVRSAFCPVRILEREHIVDPRHGSRGPEISVPGDAVATLREIGILKLVRHTSPQVVVVVENPDFGVERVLLEGRTKELFHKLNLVLLPPHALRHAAALVGVDLVLDRHGLDMNSDGGLPLKKLDEALN